jgi:hypothetical protein
MRQLAPGMACSRAMQEQLPRVLSFLFPLRFLYASQPTIMGGAGEVDFFYNEVLYHHRERRKLEKTERSTCSPSTIVALGALESLPIFWSVLQTWRRSDRLGSTQVML